MPINFIEATTFAVALATPAFSTSPDEVLETYADIAATNYEDSLITAKRLQSAGNALA